MAQQDKVGSRSISKELYCRFLRDHGHLIEDCLTQKEQIEALIRQGKLQRFVGCEKHEACPLRPSHPNGQAEDNPRGPVGEIRTIMGGLALGGTSHASKKAYAR